MKIQAPYKMGTLSRLTGLSPILLRAWERRYGLLQPERGTGGHRLYTDGDLAVLQKTRKLLDAGRSIGEIAALGREAILSDSPGTIWSAGPAGNIDAADRLKDRYRAGMIEAAAILDEDALKRELDAAAATLSIPMLIEGVIEPAAREIGDLWQSGKCTVASEHLASIVFVHRLRKIIDAAESLWDQNSPLVIAACLPGEEHHLGLLIVSYFLNCHGVRVLCLGASLPFKDLVQASGASRPRAVLLSVTRPQTFRKERGQIRSLLNEIDGNARVYLGGAGAPEKDAVLERAGLQISPSTEPARAAAGRIAQDLGATQAPKARKRLAR